MHFYPLKSNYEDWAVFFLITSLKWINYKSYDLIFTGQFMFDKMSMTNILNNQEIAQALADGLMELSKENSVSIFFRREHTIKPQHLNKCLLCIYCMWLFFLNQFIPPRAQFLRKITSVCKNSHWMILDPRSITYTN